MNQQQAPDAETDSLSERRQPMPPTTGQSEHQSPASETSRYGTISQSNPAPATNYSWSQNLRRNRPMSRTLNAATMIFMSGGMSLSKSVGFGPILEYGTVDQYCWFIAVIIGACISAPLTRRTTNVAFNLSASMLVIANGILHIVFPESTSWIVLARYCDGIAFGLTIIPTIITGSELSSKMFRGVMMSVEQSGLSTGAMLSILFTKTLKEDMVTNRIHGITALVFGGLALIYTFAFTTDSPVFHLRKNNEAEAIKVLRELQKPGIVTANDEIMATLNENKALLEEDLIRGSADNISNSWIPLLKISIFRAFVSTSFSLPLVWAFILASTASAEGNDPNLFIYILMRLIGQLIALRTLDQLGRRTPCALLLLLSSIFLVGIGSLFSNFFQLSYGGLYTLMAFLLIHQLLSGFVAPASTCYLGEAFSVSVKPYCILASIVFENIIQIIVCSKSRIDSSSNYAYTLAALQFIFAIVFQFTIPETKQTTLREALAKFKTTVYINLGNA